VKVQSQNSTITYTYDPRNRLLQENYLVNPGLPSRAGYTVTYSYNGEELGSVRYPDNLLVGYSYDDLGRVTSVYQQGANPYARLSYTANDQPKGIAYANGITANYTYDSMSRPSNLTIWVPQSSTTWLSLVYSYNRTGTLAGVTGFNKGGCGTNTSCSQIVERYTYDSLQRLQNATVQSGGVSSSLWYEYGNASNRAFQSYNGIVTSYAYNLNNNELASSTAAASGTTILYGYDKNGNLLNRTVTQPGKTVRSTYTWDVLGNLLKVANDTSVLGSYAYDGYGRRLVSLEGPTRTFYAYFGTETLYENTSGTVSDYVYVSGFRIARVTGRTVNYYQTDPLGSTRLVTDSNGNVLFSDNYQPFGQDNARSGTETYRFTGKPYSSATGFYYYYRRWYDPSIGRFISQD